MRELTFNMNLSSSLLFCHTTPAPNLPKSIQSLHPVPLQHCHSSGTKITLITCLHEALNYRVLMLHDSSFGGCLHRD